MDNNNRPSDDLFIVFWKTKYSEFMKEWHAFNNEVSVPEGRWETAIAIMPNDENAQRYNFLNIEQKTGRKLSMTDMGRNFGGISFFDYCSKHGFSLKDEYTEDEIDTFYKELCEVEFPEKSFSDPTKFKYDMELNFEEYKTTHGDKNPNATIKEHLVFPYDFAVSYPIPLFQPQASIYFLTRIRDANKYATSSMPDSLTTEETILLKGTYGSRGIDSFLNEFLTSAGFREWERTVNAELSVLRYIAFIRDLRYSLDKENKNWIDALQASLPSLIRGKIDICDGSNVHHDSNGADNQELLCNNDDCDNAKLPMREDYIAIDLMKVIGKVFVVNTGVGWNAITESRLPLLNRYRNLVSEVVGLMKTISDKETEELESKTRAKMYELLRPHVETLVGHLSDAERSAAFVRAVILPPTIAIISSGASTHKFFENGHQLVKFANRQLFSSHDYSVDEQTNCRELVGAAILTSMGIENTVVTSTKSLWDYANELMTDTSNASELSFALKQAIMTGAGDDGEIFTRAKHCFHTPFKDFKDIPASLIVACFPESFNALKESLVVRYKLKYGDKVSNKINAIFELFRSVGRNYTISVIPPTTGVVAINGSVTIKASYLSSSTDQYVIDCTLWNDLCTQYLNSTLALAKGSLVRLLSDFFGIKQKLTCENMKISIENEDEYIHATVTFIEIKFIILS